MPVFCSILFYLSQTKGFFKWHTVSKWFLRYWLIKSLNLRTVHLAIGIGLKWQRNFQKSVNNIFLRGYSQDVRYYSREMELIATQNDKESSASYLNFPTLNLRQNFPILSRCSSGSSHFCPQTLRHLAYLCMQIIYKTYYKQ